MKLSRKKMTALALICALSISGFASAQSPNVAPARSDSSQRATTSLNDARRCERDGRLEEAADEYRFAIQPESLDAADGISGYTRVSIALADRAGDSVSRARYLVTSHALLSRIRESRPEFNLDSNAKDALYDSLKQLEAISENEAKYLLGQAWTKFNNAKGVINDSEAMQRDALHQMYTAWAYKAMISPPIISEMIRVTQSLKDEFSTEEYNEIRQQIGLLATDPLATQGQKQDGE